MRLASVRSFFLCCLSAAALTLSACGGGGGGTDAPLNYTVGGTVSGLPDGASLSVVNNGSETLAVSSNGAFTFKTGQLTATAYAVTVSAQPAGQVCTVAKGSGTLAAANVADIAVTCAPIPTYQLGGTVSGLLGGTRFTLVSAGSDSADIAANGAFQFATKLTSGTTYSVSASTQPAGQTCTVSNGNGSVAAADIANIAVVCTPIPTYSIGGSASGLTTGLTLGLSLSLPNGVTQAVNLTAGGNFAFPTPVVTGTVYATSIATQPVGQTCVLSNGSGTVAQANVTNLGIACTTNPPATYAIHGTVTGLASGASVSLRNNAGTPLTVTANGGFDFPAQVTATPYAVTVSTQPSAQTVAKDQTCTVSNGNGTVAGADVTAIAVNCVTNTYAISATVSGLNTGGSFTLLNNGGGAQTVTANGAVTVATAQTTGTAYAVSAGSQPSGQTCQVSNGTGTVATSNITGVTVTCTSIPQFALVVNFSSSTISTFVVTPGTGALVASGTAVSSGGTNPNSIAVTPNGKFAYVTNQTSNTISAFSVDATTGALTPIGAPLGTGAVPAAVTMHPGGGLVYTANRSGNSLTAYAINATTGALTALGSTASSNEPRDITFNPAGTYAYVTQWAGNTITAYSVNTATGALTPIAGGPYATGANPYDVTVDPSGRFVYTVNYSTTATSGTVSAYAITAGTGALTAIGSPVAAGVGPFSLTVDSAGRTLYVANYSQVFLSTVVPGNTVSTYTINGTTGALTASGSTVATGAYPNAIKLDVTGSWAYVVNSDANTISRYSVNASTGELTSLGAATPAGSAPWALVLVQPTP